MSATVIVATYRQPRWLDLCLRGFAAQRRARFEVVVADDGSGEDTRRCIARVAAETGLPVRHVWHEDDGFRKCRILNAAIAAAEGDYLVFTDGDCIPRVDFVATHLALREPGRFLSGGYAKLPADTSRVIVPDDVADGRATDYRWLREHGTRSTRALRRLAIPRFIGRVLDLATPTRPSFNGHNASVWMADLDRVNGFNEDMGYGGLDRELGERLENAGIRGKQIRHRAHVVHLDHPRDYRDPAVLARNREIRREVARTRRTRAEVGLDRHRAAQRRDP